MGPLPGMLFPLLTRVLPMAITITTSWGLSLSLAWAEIWKKMSLSSLPSSPVKKDVCPHVTNEKLRLSKRSYLSRAHDRGGRWTS